jgi:hypothetical protein
MYKLINNIFFVGLLLFSCKDSPTPNSTNSNSKTVESNKPILHEPKDTSLKILSAGHLIIRPHSLNIVANKWGFEYRHIGGCDVTQELRDSIQTNNDFVDSVLKRRFGNGWEKRFAKEVKAEDQIDQKVIKIVDRIPVVIEKRKANSDETIRYTLKPISYTSKYKVEGNYVASNPMRVIRTFSLIVDYKTNEAQILSDKDTVTYQQPEMSSR